jgi:hypothetical protein
MPDLESIAGYQGMSKDSLLVDPGTVCAIPIVENTLALFNRDNGVVPRDHELIGQHNIIVRVAADRQSLRRDAEPSAG